MNFEQRLLQFSHLLNENDRHIAHFILDNPTCFKWSISQFANTCLVSKTSVIRFCQKIDLPGFGELKAILKWEQNTTFNPTPLSSLVQTNYEKMIKMILENDMHPLFECLKHSKRVILYGSGARQSRVTNEFKRIFLPTQKTLVVVNDEELIDSLKNTLETTDILFIFSLRGERQKIIDLAKFCKIKNIPLVSITGMHHNTLSSLSRFPLYINAIKLPDEYHLDYEIVTPYFMLVELLYILYQRYVQNSKT